MDKPDPRLQTLLQAVERYEGFVAAVVIDIVRAEVTLSRSTGTLDIARGAVDLALFVRVSQYALGAMGVDDTVEEICTTLGDHYHLLFPIDLEHGVFLHVALLTSATNLALAQIACRAAVAEYLASR